MGTFLVILTLFCIVLCILTSSTQYLLVDERLQSGLAYLEQLTPQAKLAFEHQVHTQLIKNNQNSSLINLIGLLNYEKGNWLAASQYFSKASQVEGYGHEAFVRNWIEAERKINSSNIIITLRNKISKNMERTPLLQALIDEVRISNSEYSYRQMLEIIRQFPTRYEFWLVFVDLHINYHFTENRKHVGGTMNEASYEEEALLVQYGLTMYPNSPELLLVRTIHLLSINEVECAEVFMEKTQRYRDFDQSAIRGTHYEAVAGAVASAVAASAGASPAAATASSVERVDNSTMHCIPSVMI